MIEPPVQDEHERGGDVLCEEFRYGERTYRSWRRRALGLSGAVASVLIALVVVKHLGWLGGASALLRRRRAEER